jgi:hypothetical protein
MAALVTYPTTAGQVVFGSSPHAYTWVDTSNILSSNNSRASVTFGTSPYDWSYMIYGGGFDVSTLTSGDILNSVTLMYEGYVSPIARPYPADHVIAWGLSTWNPGYGPPLQKFQTSETTLSWSYMLPTITISDLLDPAFKIGIVVYGATTSLTYYLDTLYLVIDHITPVTKTFSDTVTAGQVTDSCSLTSSSFPYQLANHNRAYVLNMKTGGWRYHDNAPFTNIIYRPTTNELIGARRNLGNVSKVNSGTTFDGTDISSVYRSGYYNFGKLDENQRFEDDLSEAIKQIRAHYSEVKSGGNLILTIFTENDSVGDSFTITPATSDNVTYNQIRTALSKDVHGKYVSFQLANVSGCDFYVGEQRLKIKSRKIR